MSASSVSQPFRSQTARNFKSSFVAQLGAAVFLGVVGLTSPNTALAEDNGVSAGKHFKSALKLGRPGSKGHAPKQKVGACVVDLWDVSSSVSRERFEMERKAIVATLKSKEFGHALKLIRHGQIAINMAFFNQSLGQKRVTDGWFVVDQKTRFDLADKIEKISTPSLVGWTNTHQAVLFGIKELETCDSGAPIIDIVTDGKANHTTLCSVEEAHNCAAAIPFMLKARREASFRGITINVLAAETPKSPGLDRYAVSYMATPGYEAQSSAVTFGSDEYEITVAKGLHFRTQAVPGKVFHINGTDFSDPAKWFAKFEEMRRRKLIEEISAAPAANSQG